MSNNQSNSFLLHVSSTQSREIHSFAMDAYTGKLTLIEAIKVPGTGEPTRGNIPLVWGQDKTVLYAHIRIEPFPLTAFSLDSLAKTLKPLETISMPAPMAYFSTGLSGKFLFGASYDGALVTVNQILPDGRLSAPCEQVLPTPPKAHCIIPASFDGFMYATSVDGDAILVYSLDRTTGRLNELEELRVKATNGSGPRHLVFHPQLDCLYCINEHNGSLSVYKADRCSGALERLQNLSLVPTGFAGNALASDIHITPDGSYIYASVRNTNTISGFRIDQIMGTLSAVGTFDAEKNPRGFAIDPKGRFLVCAGQETNHIAVYKLEPYTGRLMLVDRYPVGKRPGWIEIIDMPRDSNL